MSFDARLPVRRLATLVALAALTLTGLAVAWPGSPSSASTADEATLASLANSARAAAGLPPLAVSGALSDTARSHSAAMAAADTLFHSTGLAGTVGESVAGWTSLAENVAVAGSATEAHQALMASAEHRAHILGDFTLLGVGVVTGSDGRLWVTQHFAKAPTSAITPEATTTTTATTAVVTAGSVDTTVVATTQPAPAPKRSAKATPKPQRTTTMRAAGRPARTSARPGPAAGDGSCLPEPAQDHGVGHAYGRCEDGPEAGAAGARPSGASDGQGRQGR